MSRILIIDDSSFQRGMVRRIVQESGYETIEASNGKDGLAMIDSEDIDCILLDLVMPEMTGVEVLEQLQAQHCSVPVIVVSADIQESTHDICRQLGALSIINKPVKKNELNTVLTEALGDKAEVSDVT